MRTWRGFAVWGLLTVLAYWGPAAMAQDPAPGEAPATVTGQRFEQEKRHFGLYVAFAGGEGSSDPLGTSIAAGPLDVAVSSVELTKQLYGRGAIGWRLKDARKGDFRVVVQGFREEEYEFLSQGVSNAGGPDLNCSLNPGEGDSDRNCLIRWWEINVVNGDLTAVRHTPLWDLTADTDGDGKPDFGLCTDLGQGIERCGEIFYDRNSPDRLIEGQIADDLQNRIQTFDAMYGREFGGRRFSSRWWTGLRYFTYEGQMLAAAWLNLTTPGEHFTDGSFLKLLRITQETTGYGPLGSWEIDFNFFDRGVVLYLRGEVAFTFNSMKIDSGPFFRVSTESSSITPAILVEDRMRKELNKSTWQNRGEAGARINLKNGLQFEVGYSRNGYLDIIMMPDLLQLGGPLVTNENPQTFTQDIIVDAFHAGVGFQF